RGGRRSSEDQEAQEGSKETRSMTDGVPCRPTKVQKPCSIVRSAARPQRSNSGALCRKTRGPQQAFKSNIVPVETAARVRSTRRSGFVCNLTSPVARESQRPKLAGEDALVLWLWRCNVPGKPSIVFAHGLWADGSCFGKVIELLVADGYEVI